MALANVGTPLPEDMIFNILSRLPVKSLMRLKCVCKSWRSLLESPAFITQHLNNDNDECLLFSGIYYASSKQAFSLFHHETLDVIETLDFPHFKDDDGKWVNVAGCCYGIFCVAERPDTRRSILWNPATREFKILPQSNAPRPPRYDAENVSLGFGFDSITHDYKVVQLVRLLSCSDEPYCESFHQVELYNLTTHCWSKSDAVVPPLIYIDTTFVYFNGTCYWLAHYGSFHLIIVSFHITKQVVRTISFPDCWKLIRKTRPGRLCVVNDSIAMVIDLYSDEWNYTYQVWILNKDYSWTKLYTSEPIPELRFFTLAYWRNDGVFADSEDGHLVLLNPVTQEIKPLQFDPMRAMSINIYKESLVPLN